MIPEEAVEAAAIGIWNARPMERVYKEGPDYGAAKPWDTLKPYQHDRYRTLARAALEAAAYHMLAGAWDEGVRSTSYPDGSRIEWPGHIPPNPYRSQA